MEIQVTLRNQTPIFSAAPGDNRIDLDGNINPPGMANFPLTRTRTMVVIAEQMEGVMKPAYVPVVPSNTMRNLLRRTMLKEILEPHLKGNVQLSIGAYATAYSGSASGNPDGVPGTFDEVAQMRAHPFIGLFGGGPRMLQGRLMVDTLYPLHVNAKRVLGEGFESDLINGKITDIVWTRRVDPILQLQEESDTDVIQGGVSAANQWIQDLLSTNKGKASKGKAKNKDTEEEVTDGPRSLRAFNAHEVVVAGVNWLWRINADKPTDAQIGLILMALSKLSNQRVAGGHAKNYGQVVVESIKLDGQEVWAAGQLNDDATQHYCDALANALDGMNGEAFEAFAASVKEA